MCQWYTAKIIMCVLLLSLFSKGGHAQDESDLRKWPETIHDSLYFELFKASYQNDLLLGKYYIVQSLKLSRKHDHPNLVLKALNGLGFVYSSLKEYDSALHFFDQAIELGVKHNNAERLMFTYGNIGYVYLNVGNNDLAIDYFFKALKFARQCKNAPAEASALHNIGQCYGQIGNYSDALKYYNECLKVSDNAGEDFQIQTKINTAFLCTSMKKYREAIKVFEDVVKLSKGKTNFLIYAYQGLASVYIKQGNISEASVYTLLSIDHCKSINDRYFLAKNYYSLGEIAYIQKKHTEAIGYLKKALVYAREVSSLGTEQEINLLLSEIYFDKGDFKNSSIAREQAYILKDSLFNERFAENFKNIHLKIAKEKSDEIINNQEAELVRQETEVEKQRLFVIAFGIILVIAMGAFVAITHSHGKVADANKVIEKQNKELKHFANTLEILIDERTVELKAANSSLEKANTRLNGLVLRIVDELRGPMLNLKAACEIAERDLKDHPFAFRHFTKIQNYVLQVRIIFNNTFFLSEIDRFADVVEIVRFKELVEEVIRREERRKIPKKIKITRFVADNIYFQADRKLMLIILGNLIENAIKFYNPAESVESFVDIDISIDGKNLLIVITDNGLGIDDETRGIMFKLPHPSQHIGGLYIVKAACERLGGIIFHNTSKEGETEFTVVLPLPETMVKPVSLN